MSERNIGFFGSTMEVDANVDISGGVASVTFADGVVFEFEMTLPDNAKEIEDDPENGVYGWHLYSIRAEISKCYMDPGFGMATLYNPFELQDVFEALRDYPAIEFLGAPHIEGGWSTFLDFDEYGDPVSTGSTTFVDMFGTVSHIVDQEKYVVANITHPNHWLHDGYIVRHVYDDGNPAFFSLQTVGFGTGWAPRSNAFFGPLVWDHVTSDIIEGFASRKYFDRTGENTPAMFIESE